MILRICILAIAAITLFSCNLPEQSSVTQSNFESPKSVKTRAVDDFLWDTGKTDHEVYTGFSQVGERWICGRISMKNENLWWFNKEGESREDLIKEVSTKEQNYEGSILKRMNAGTYVFDSTENGGVNYYNGLKFVYRGNGELEWYNGDQLIAVFQK